MRWNPGSGASWSLPTGAWSSGLTSVPVPRLGRGKWEEPEIALEGSVLGSGLHWAEGKGFWTTSPTHLSSVQGHARHKTKYLPRPPGSSAGAFMSAPSIPFGSSQCGIQSSLSFLPPFSRPIFLSRTLFLFHPGVQPTRNSSSSGVGGSFRNLQGKESSAPQGYELGSDPGTAAGSLRKETPAAPPTHCILAARRGTRST